MTAPVTIVVPTLGRSPYLEECLRALRAEAAPLGAEVVLVEQGDGVAEPVGALADRRVRVPRRLGFAAAANLGIAAGAGPWVALVNDDAVVAVGWLGSLVGALDAEPRAASAQGLNLLVGEPERVDGLGLAWNRWLQAVQLGHGEPAPAAAAGVEGPRDVFGVAATAALYRRQALAAVAGPPRGSPPAPAEVFDSRLDSYYEDVDLAVRLRAAGFTALAVPATRARHAGGLTAGAGVGRWRRVYGNRHLVVARLLGGRFWLALPRLAARDLLDLGRAAASLDLRRAAGIVAGWGRAARRLPRFVHAGPPVLGRGGLAAAVDPSAQVEAR